MSLAHSQKLRPNVERNYRCKKSQNSLKLGAATLPFKMEINSGLNWNLNSLTFNSWHRITKKPVYKKTFRGLFTDCFLGSSSMIHGADLLGMTAILLLSSCLWIKSGTGRTAKGLLWPHCAWWIWTRKPLSVTGVSKKDVLTRSCQVWKWKQVSHLLSLLS